MKIKRIVATVASTALLALIAAGCGAKKETKKTTEKVTNSIVTTTKKPNKTSSSSISNTTRRTTGQQTTTSSGEVVSKDTINFADSDNDKASIQARALAAFDKVYTDSKNILPQSEWNSLEVLYQKAINLNLKVTGTVDEMKTTLNGVYKTLNDNIEILKKTSNTLAGAKEVALEKIDLIKSELEEFVNEYTMICIDYAIQELKSAVNNATSIDAVNEIITNGSADAKRYAMTIISDEVATAISTRISELDTIYTKLQSVATQADLAECASAIKMLKAEIASSLSLDEIDEADEDLLEFKIGLYEKYDNVVSIDLADLKAYAKIIIDNYQGTVITTYVDNDLKNSIITILDGARDAIDDISDESTFDSTVELIFEEARAYVESAIANKIGSLKEEFCDSVNTKVAALKAKIDDSALKAAIDESINNTLNSLNSINSLEGFYGLKDSLEDSIDQTLMYFANAYTQVLLDQFTTAFENYYSQIQPYIADQEIKGMLDDFVETYAEEIQAISNIDDAVDFKTNTLPDMVSDFEDIVETIINKAKAIATSTVNAKKDEILAKITDSTLVTKINNAYTTYETAIGEITSLDTYATDISDALDTVIIAFKKVVAESIAELRIRAMLSATEIKTKSSVSAYDYIPDAMKSTYYNNAVDPSSINYDFTNFVNIADINFGGFGEQWNMVVENLDDSDKMLSVINKASTYIGALCDILVEYYDSDICDEISYETDNDNYQASVLLTESNEYILTFKLKNGISIPLFGTVAPEITYTIADNRTEIFVKLSNTNKLRYVKTNNQLTVALEYGIDAGSRVSYLSFEEDSSHNVTGEIYENLTLKNNELAVSRAKIYINSEYVSVVGNKADGIKGMKGYINELYKSNEGKLLGYEIKETLTIAGVSGTYNTLWFNLNDIDNITSVKLTEHTEGNENDKNDNDVYVNNSTSLFKPAWNKKLTVKTSRKFDIEFRTRYFYSYNESTEEYEKHEILIPMMFIQEGDNFTSFQDDMAAENEIEDVTVKMNSDDLAKVLSDYDTYIEEFEKGTDLSTETITDFIDGE